MNSSKRSAKYQEKPKTNQASKIKFVITCNPMLPKVDDIIKKQIPVLHSDDALKTLFPTGCFSPIYNRNKNLKELIAPSICNKNIYTRTSSIRDCDNCNICKNYMIFDNTFI